jgi:DNA-binding CsgD family transcriptional regulator
MRNGLEELTEREKETLRFLLAGNDAKSIAREQGLSVHTVNERLRDARAKLGVSSSREAARILAKADRGDPHFLTDKKFGVAGPPGLDDGSAGHRAKGSHRLAWLMGGLLVVSLFIAALAFSLAFSGTEAPGTQGLQHAPAAASAASNIDAASSAAAHKWAELLDTARWDESWRSAATLFRSQVPANAWVSQVRSVRHPLGAVSSRALQSATKATSLPGAPEGEYEILQFRTHFAGKSDAVETIVLVRESGGWKVSGYFIR